MHGGGVHFPTTFSKKIKIRSQLLELAVKSQKKKPTIQTAAVTWRRYQLLKPLFHLAKQRKRMGKGKVIFL